MRERKDKALSWIILIVGSGMFLVLAGWPVAAEECRRQGRAVSQEALCCNMKRVQRCAGAHGWADYPTEVCDRGEDAAASTGTKRRTSPLSTARSPATGGSEGGCFDCEGTFHETGQTVRNTGHEQVCRAGKWETVDRLKSSESLRHGMPSE